MARTPTRAAAPPPPPEKPPEPPNPLKMGRLDRLRWLAEKQQEAWVTATAKNSHVAAGAALKELKVLLGEIEEEEKRSGNEQVSEEVYYTQLEQASRELATQHLEVFVREFMARHPGVKLVRQGAACGHCGKHP